MNKNFAAVCAALMVVAGCSGGAEAAPPTTSAAPDPQVVVRGLVLGDQDMVAKGLVKAGEPQDGVQVLLACPDLASAGQAVAGVTATWTWSGPDQQATVTQYSAIYSGITGKDVVKQARAASTCARGAGSVASPLGLDEYFYGQDNSMGTTKPFVDDRFAYCLLNYLTNHSVCTAVQAKGDKVIRVTIDLTGRATDSSTINAGTFAQAVTDRLVA